MSSTAISRRDGWTKLRDRLTRPATIVAATVIALNVVRVISSMVLSRLLDVEAFGIVGFLTSITVVFGLISDLGITTYIIRSKDGDDARFLDQIWTIRFVRSFVLSAAMAALAWPLAAYINQPHLGLLIAVYGLTFLCEGLTSLGGPVSVRYGRVIRISLFDLAGAVLQTVLTIAFAWLLRDYWALVYGVLIGGLVKAALSYWLFPSAGRRWRWSTARATELWQFSRFIVGSSILTMLITQSDKLILSRGLPLAEFSLYVIATTLSQAPAGFVGPYVNRVLLPLYSRLSHDNPGILGREYYAWRRKITLLFALATGGLITTAPLIIEILYDDRYRGAAMYLQILAVGAVFVLNTQCANAVLIAMGRMSTTMISSMIRLGWLIVAGVAGYVGFGSIGLVVALATAEIAAQFYYWWALHRAGILSVREEALPIGIALTGAAIGYGVNLAGLYVVRFWM